MEKMEIALRDILTSLPEEEKEFYTRGLIAMLNQQKVLHRIADRKFQLKFTTLFRLYGPLIQECYDRPELLLKAYLTWENSFFNKIHLCHHRDAARTKHLPDMVRLLEADDETLGEEVTAFSEQLVKKLEDARIKDAELKLKRAAKKKDKKKKKAFQMSEEDGNVMLKESLALRRYRTDIRDLLEETTVLVETKPLKLELDKDQLHVIKCRALILQMTTLLQKKIASAANFGDPAPYPLLVVSAMPVCKHSDKILGTWCDQEVGQTSLKGTSWTRCIGHASLRCYGTCLQISWHTSVPGALH